MKKSILLLLVVVIPFSGCSTLSKLEGIYNSSIGSMIEAEKLLEQVDVELDQKHYAQALVLCDRVIQDYGSTPTLSEKGVSNYGAIGREAKEEVLCEQRKNGLAPFVNKNTLVQSLKSALQHADSTQIEHVLSCGIGRATPDSDHRIHFDTLSIAHELAALRKENGALISFTADGTDFVLTSGYSDGKARRFAIVFEKETNSYYVESFIEGAPAEVAALPQTLSKYAPPVLTAAEQQQLRQDFALYTDPDGLVVSEPNPGINTSGNGLLYTSYYYMTLQLYNILADTDRQSFTSTVQACRKDGINGLYNRTPTKTDQEGPDDYYGLIGAAAKANVNAQMSTDIYQYGSSTRVGLVNFVYNNENPGQFSFSAWLGRQPQLVAHSEMSVGKRPAIWRRVVWLGSVQFSSTKNPEGNQDIVLTWLQAANIHPKLRAMKLVAKDWKKRLLKNYPNGMKDVFAVYFNNPNHPLAKWALTDFGWQY